MTSRHKKALTALTVFLAFSFTQVYVQASLPAPAPGAGAPQHVITAKLVTTNNAPITVNGNSAGTGATILTGATIETPDQVSAKIDLGDAGVIELQPGSKIQLDFDADGNVHVKVLKGCVVVKRKTNVLPDATTEIYTDTQSEKTNKDRKSMGFCLLPNGSLSAISATATGGLSGGEVGGIVGGIGGGVILAVLLTRGGNTSPER